MYQNDNRLREIITIQEISLGDKQNVVTSTLGQKYSFFQTKQDNSMTSAYQTIQGFRVGDTVQVVYKLNGQYKNAVGFYSPTEKGQSSQSTPVARPAAPTNTQRPQNAIVSPAFSNKDEMIGVLALIKAVNPTLDQIQDSAFWQAILNGYRRGARVIAGEVPSQGLAFAPQVAPEQPQQEDINVEDIPF